VVKRFFILLNAAFAITILELIARVYIASFLIMQHYSWNISHSTLILSYHSLYWGLLAWDFHYLSCFHIHVHSITCSVSFSLLIAPYSTVSSLDTSTSSFVFFIVRITCLPILKSQKLSRASLVKHFLYNFRFSPCIVIVNHFYWPTNTLNYTKLRV